jgi:probable phosphoglycerate mutase
MSSMPRQILLVRHCQSQANADGRLEGKGDSPLSEAGREQAKRVAAFIAALGVASRDVGAATLIASPLARARATAAEIAALCGWTASHDPRIRECEMGWMEDLSYADVRQHMIDNQLTVLDHTVHGGETLDALAERFWDALSEALAATEGPLIAVSHGIAIHALVERRFGHELGLAQIGNGDVFEVWLEGDAATGPPTRYPLG